MMIRFRESGPPVLRITSPLSRGTLKNKGGVKFSIHFCVDGETIETVFRTILSVNQPSIYGAVSDLCDEYSLVKQERGDPFESARLLMTTPTPSTEVPAHENFIAKIQTTSDPLINICTDAGFLTQLKLESIS